MRKTDVHCLRYFNELLFYHTLLGCFDVMHHSGSESLELPNKSQPSPNQKYLLPSKLLLFFMQPYYINHIMEDKRAQCEKDLKQKLNKNSKAKTSRGLKADFHSHSAFSKKQWHRFQHWCSPFSQPTHTEVCLEHGEWRKCVGLKGGWRWKMMLMMII